MPYAHQEEWLGAEQALDGNVGPQSANDDKPST